MNSSGWHILQLTVVDWTKWEKLVLSQNKGFRLHLTAQVSDSIVKIMCFTPEFFFFHNFFKPAVVAGYQVSLACSAPFSQCVSNKGNMKTVDNWTTFELFLSIAEYMSILSSVRPPTVE